MNLVQSLQFKNDKTDQINLIKYFILNSISPFYYDKNLHFNLLIILLNFFIDENSLQMNKNLTSEFPMQKFERNYLFEFQIHLQYPSVSNYSFELKNYIKNKIKNNKNKFNRYSTLLILLKLCSSNLNSFEELYNISSKISNGAFSTVFKVIPKNCINLMSENYISRVVKLVKSPKNGYERNSLFFILSEILILEKVSKLNEKLKFNPFLEIISFGYLASKNVYYILFPKLEYLRETRKHYQSSSESLSLTNRFDLHASGNSSEIIPFVLKIMAKIINDIKILHKNRITHFDIKADNIMYKNTDNSKIPILIDFGESLLGGKNERLRGTEYMRSPEMLKSSQLSEK